MKIALLFAVISIVLLNSCATIVSGTSQDVIVNTTPKARIEIKASSGLLYYSGYTPASVKLPRKYTYTVTIPGGVVDAVTGAMWNLEPSLVNITLERVSAKGQEELQLVFTSTGNADYRGELRIPLEIM